MDKLIFAICLLATLFSISSGPDTARMDWEFALHAGRRCVTDLKIEFCGPCEWQIVVRERIRTLRICSHWRPGHA
jgi:hypothetical protein